MANQKTQLLLSSEWNYSPFIFDRVSNLENFLFIGLPAPESGNPLLVPLAGHELGHAVWHRDEMRRKLQAAAQAAVVKAIQANWNEYKQTFPTINIQPDELRTNLFAVESWRLASEWCLDQAEETFCDFVGLAIFGESYFHSFGYLLSPGIGSRSTRYPEVLTRVSRLVNAASELDSVAPPNFVELFEKELPAAASPAEAFLLRIADQAIEQLTNDLVGQAKVVVDHAAVPRSSSEVERILGRIKQMVPAEGCKAIADIINAAWQAYDNADLWKDYHQMQNRKTEVLKDLILKNLEIFEIERIQSE